MAEAVDTADSYIDGGMSPDEALAKAAKEYDLNNDQTHLMVRGWNISNVQEKLATHRDLNERLNPIQVVSLDAITSKLANMEDSSFTEKQANYESNEIWGGYYIAPKENPPVVLGEDPFLKYADQDPTTFERKLAETDAIVNKSRIKIAENLRLAKEELKVLKGRLETKIAEIEENLFYNKIPIDIALANTKLAYPRVYNILKKVADRSNLLKRADYDNPNMEFNKNTSGYKEAFEAVDIVDDIVKLKKAADKLEEYNEILRDEDTEFKYELSIESSPLQKTGGFHTRDTEPVISKPLFNKQKINSFDGELENFFQKTGAEYGDSLHTVKTSQDTGLDSSTDSSHYISEKELQQLQDAAQIQGKALGESIGSIKPTWFFEGYAPADLESSIRSKLQEADLEHPATVARAQGFVAKLIATDPILADHDPYNVFKAYRNLLELVPTLMQNEAVAKEVLKKYLEQGEVLDTYDLRQLAEMESKLRKAPTTLATMMAAKSLKK